LDGGNFTFSPGSALQYLAVGESALISFSYVATDIHGAVSEEATVSITAEGVNQAPTAVDDLLIGDVDEDQLVEFNAATLLGNDTDPDLSDTITVTAVSIDDAANGAVSLDVESQLITYDPNGMFEAMVDGEHVEVELNYTISDDHGATDDGIFTLTINGVGAECEVATTFLNYTKDGDAGNNTLCLDSTYQVYNSDMNGFDGDDNLTLSSQLGYISYANIDAGLGDDTATLSSHINMTRNNIYGQDGDDVLLVINRSESVSADNTLYNYVEGGAGNDTVTIDHQDNNIGVSSSDDIRNNRIDGNDGDDIVALTVNTDTYYNGYIVSNALNGQDGADDVDLTINQHSTFRYLNSVASNTASGGLGDDTLHLTVVQENTATGRNDVFANTLSGNEGVDAQAMTISQTGGNLAYVYQNNQHGGDEADSISLNVDQSAALLAYSYTNTLYGDDGEDTISITSNQTSLTDRTYFYDQKAYGGAGDDLMSMDIVANAQNSPYVYYNYMYGGAGEDTMSISIDMTSANGGPSTTQGYSNASWGGTGNDVLTFHIEGGYTYWNSLNGDDGNDTLTMTDSADGYLQSSYLRGGNGNDVLTMNTNNVNTTNNFIQAGAGDDIANSGIGTDRIYLGTGIDTVEHDVGDGLDYVFDFTAGSGDLIDLTDHGLASVTVSQSGGYAVIDLGAGDSVYINSTSAASLVKGIDYIL
jgi:Ca2+-binding RTX toxin-like protein